MPHCSSLSVDALRARSTEPIDVSALYSKLAAAGLQYGPQFRLIRDSTRSSGGEVGKEPMSQARLPITGQHTGDPPAGHFFVSKDAAEHRREIQK